MILTKAADCNYASNNSKETFYLLNYASVRLTISSGVLFLEQHLLCMDCLLVHLNYDQLWFREDSMAVERRCRCKQRQPVNKNVIYDKHWTTKFEKISGSKEMKFKKQHLI